MTGRWLVTSGPGQGHLWDLAAPASAGSRPLPRAFPGPFPGLGAVIANVAFSQDSHWLATVGTGVRLWDLSVRDALAKPVNLQSLTTLTFAVAISSDARRLATADNDGTARVWELDAAGVSHRPIVLRGHSSAIRRLTLSADRHWFSPHVATTRFDCGT